MYRLHLMAAILSFIVGGATTVDVHSSRVGQFSIDTDPAAGMDVVRGLWMIDHESETNDGVESSHIYSIFTKPIEVGAICSAAAMEVEQEESGDFRKILFAQQYYYVAYSKCEDVRPSQFIKVVGASGEWDALRLAEIVQRLIDGRGDASFNFNTPQASKLYKRVGLSDLIGIYKKNNGNFYVNFISDGEMLIVSISGLGGSKLEVVVTIEDLDPALNCVKDKCKDKD